MWIESGRFTQKNTDVFGVSRSPTAVRAPQKKNCRTIRWLFGIDRLVWDIHQKAGGSLIRSPKNSSEMDSQVGIMGLLARGCY